MFLYFDYVTHNFKIADRENQPARPPPAAPTVNNGEQTNNIGEKRRWSNETPQNTGPVAVTPTTPRPQQQQTPQTQNHIEPSTAQSLPLSSSTPAKQLRKSLPELEAATSTTQPDHPSQRIATTEPGEWTIEDVIHFIEVTDPALGVHAELFRKHVC